MLVFDDPHRPRRRDRPSAAQPAGEAEGQSDPAPALAGCSDGVDLAASQALAQQQAVFERQMRKDKQLFRVHLTMCWTTYLVLPAGAIALFIQPVAAAALLPLSALSMWNWRRMLRRDAGTVKPTTVLDGAIG